MSLYTIGYEGLSIDAFLSLLESNGIEAVVDVRELPLSRKAGFSKNALRTQLFDSGLGYIHIPALGCPKPVRDQYRADGDWSNYTRKFLAHLDGQASSLSELASLAASQNCVLLCYEADFNYCHRSFVANNVRAIRGIEICHIDTRSLGTNALGRAALAVLA